VYLCAVRDGCSRRVIGWAMADHMRTELVTDAFTMAIAFRSDRPARVIFHADYAEVLVKPRNHGLARWRGFAHVVPRLNLALSHGNWAGGVLIMEKGALSWKDRSC